MVVDFDGESGSLRWRRRNSCARVFHKIGILASFWLPPILTCCCGRCAPGYGEFLAKPLDYDEFMETLCGSIIAGRPPRPSEELGKFCPFLAPRGGVGTTILAVHLAMFLVRGFAKKVLLIDNHAQLGHVALYLGMDGSQPSL